MRKSILAQVCLEADHEDHWSVADILLVMFCQSTVKTIIGE